jgi:hypothetical protein
MAWNWASGLSDISRQQPPPAHRAVPVVRPFIGMQNAGVVSNPARTTGGDGIVERRKSGR